MKINSYKIIKYVFYILCIVSLFLSISNRVNALELNNYFFDYKGNNDDLANWTQTNATYFRVDSGRGNIYKPLYVLDSKKEILKSYDYLIFNLSLTTETQGNTQTINWLNVDWQTTCQYYSGDYVSNADGTITYQDGSHASLSYELYAYACSRYQTSVGSISATMYVPNYDLTPRVSVNLTYSDNSNTWCKLYGNLVECPINKTKTISHLGLYTHINGTTEGYRLTIYRQMQLSNDSSSTITNAINNNSTNTNNKIDNIDNTLKDSTIDTNNTNNTTSNWGNMNASNGTITNLLTLPISLLQAYVNGMNSSCSAFSLGTLFDTEIVLPCINISNLIGSTLFGIIDVLFSGFMIYGIGKKLIKIFNDFTNMKSNQVDELYGGGA